MEKRTYPSDLSDKEWRAREPLFPPSKRGQKRKWSIRTILNAIFYILKTGCQYPIRGMHGATFLLTFLLGKRCFTTFAAARSRPLIHGA